MCIRDRYEDNTGYEEVMPELSYPVDILFETDYGLLSEYPEYEANLKISSTF